METTAMTVTEGGPCWKVPARWRRRNGRPVWLNGKAVDVEWSAAAQSALERREFALTVELELYFSCLVKKFVHFHESPPAGESVAVTDQLRLLFRPVTSAACSMDLAERLGRQPEVDLDGPIARRLAPRRVWIDHRRGGWHAEFWM